MRCVARRIVAALALTATAASAFADQPPADFFPIAVFRQPTSSFDTWKSRGINTVIDFYAPGKQQERWTSAAVADGLWMIRNPRKNVQLDATQPNLLAFSHNDEPDIWNVKPSVLAAAYHKWKAAAPSVPVIANFAGADVVYQYDAMTDQKYRHYLAAVDWSSNDVYPVTQWNHPQWIDKLQSEDLDPNDPWNHSTTPFNPGTAVDKLRELSGGKKQLAYIETSFQNLKQKIAAGARGATADEVRGETWDAIIHGAKGIVYFPFTFPNNNDGTPADVAAAMTATDATIAKYGAALNSSSDASPNAMTLSGALEGTWRQYAGRTWFFVLNDSHTTQHDVTVPLPGVDGQNDVDVPEESRSIPLDNTGALTDDFAPYEMHLYSVVTGGPAAAAAAPLALNVANPQSIVLLPEPSGFMALVAMGGVTSLRRRRRRRRR